MKDEGVTCKSYTRYLVLRNRGKCAPPHFVKNKEQIRKK